MGTAGDIVLFIVELFVMLFFIYMGSTTGGLGIGFWGGVGVAVYGFAFQMIPGSIPFDVIQIIMGVICAIASMQVAGGMDYLVHLASRALRSHPRWVSYLAPLITFAMALLAGTGHTAYSVLPVIVEVAKESGTPPTVPLAVAVVGSQVAITCSPIAAATVWFADELESRADRKVGYVHILAALIPASLIAVILTAVFWSFIGPKDLYNNETFLRRLANGTCYMKNIPPSVQEKVDALKSADVEINKKLSQHTTEHMSAQGSFVEGVIMSGSTAAAIIIEQDEEEEEEGDEESQIGLKEAPAIKKFPFSAKLSVYLFLATIIIIMVYALISSESIGLFEPKVQRNDAIVSLMLLCAAVIVTACKVPVSQVPTCSTFRAGMNGCICVLGVAWMGDTFVSNHLENIKSVCGDLLVSQPWVLPIVLFVSSALLYSQASTAKAMYPATLDMGVSSMAAVASFPACSALFVLPTYPTLLAAVEMDDTGSTKIGKWVFDHSFIVPGTLCIILCVAFGFAFSAAIVPNDL